MAFGRLIAKVARGLEGLCGGNGLILPTAFIILVGG